MSKRIITYADFTGGEYGLLGEVHAPKNSWTGTNMIRLHDGSLCPRSGLVDLAPTGTAAGVVRGFGVNDPQAKAWYVQGTAVRQFANTATAQAVATLTGALGITSSQRIRSNAESGPSTLITLYGGTSYNLDHAAVTNTALTGAPGGRMCAVFGDRLLVASASGGLGTRMYYSEAGDFNTWDALGFFDVGVGYELGAVGVSRQRVTITKHDGSWWVYSGIPGVNDVLRQVFHTIFPGTPTNAPHRFAVTGDGRLWFTPPGEYPAAFDGATVQRLEHLALTDGTYADTSTTTPTVGVTGLTKPEELFISVSGGVGATGTYDRQGLLFHRKMWSKHTFSVATSGFVDGHEVAANRLFFCDGGTAGVAPKFYAWSYDLDRPPFAGQAFESIGDASGTAHAASFTLTPYWTANEDEVELPNIIVDMKTWQTGFGGNNSFSCDVTPLRRDGGDGVTQTVTFSSSVGLSATTGTLRSETLAFPTTTPPVGTGFRVRFYNIVGVAFIRCHLVLDTRGLEGTDSA